jgi:hypothetical protein
MLQYLAQDITQTTFSQDVIYLAQLKLAEPSSLLRTSYTTGMNARPIITRVFASACPTCRNYARRTATSPRTSAALHYSTSPASPSALGPGFGAANLPYQNRTRRTLRPVLSHLGRSYATASKGPGSSTSIKVIPPTAESLKTSEEFEDAELVPEDQANITVTDDAVKVSLV